MESSLLSTKILTAPQQELVLNTGVGMVHYDILKIQDKSDGINLENLDNLIITSQNAIPAINHYSIQKKDVFCVGKSTSDRLKDLGVHVVETANSAKELGDIIVEKYPGRNFTYLCGNHRRNELPEVLHTHKMDCKEIIVYESTIVHKSFDRIFAAVLFYSPRGVYAFAKANKYQPQYSICIGETTATAARELFSNVIVAKKQTVENVLVTAINVLRDDKK